MRWILLDAAVAVLALVLLVLVGLSLWRRVRALGRELARAGELVGGATAALEQLRQEPPAPSSASADPQFSSRSSTTRRVGSPA